MFVTYSCRAVKEIPVPVDASGPDSGPAAIPLRDIVASILPNDKKCLYERTNF